MCVCVGGAVAQQVKPLPVTPKSQVNPSLNPTNFTSDPAAC